MRNEVELAALPEGRRPNAIVRVGCRRPRARTAPPGPERLVSFTPDDVYVAARSSAWTPDSRQRRLPAPEPRAERAGARACCRCPRPRARRSVPPRTVLTERSKTLAQPLRRAALPEGRPALPVDVRARRLRPRLRSATWPGACRAVTQGAWIVDAPRLVRRRRPRPGPRRAQRLPLLHRHREGPARAPPLPHAPRRHRPRAPDPRGRHPPHASSPPTAASTPTPGRTRDTPPRVVGRRARTGRSAGPSRRTPARRSSASSAAPSSCVELKAKDGTPLYGSLLKPAAFDPAKKYPVVVSVYGGPARADGHQRLGRRSRRSSSSSRATASSSGPSTTAASAGRGTAFEAPIYHDLGRVELEDQLAGVELPEVAALRRPRRASGSPAGPTAAT